MHVVLVVAMATFVGATYVLLFRDVTFTLEVDRLRNRSRLSRVPRPEITRRIARRVVLDATVVGTHRCT